MIHFESKKYMPKYRMLPVEILDVVRQCYEELAAASTLVFVSHSGRDGHRNCAPSAVLEARNELGSEVARR